MNIFTAFDKAIACSGAFNILSRPNAKQRAAQRAAKERAQAMLKTRDQWRTALMVDETSAWMSLYEQRPDVLQGLAAILGLCALAKQHDDGNGEAPEIRVIRGAVSAVEQAGRAGSVLTPEAVQALSSAAQAARVIVDSCSDAAIEAACLHLHLMVRQQRA